MTYRLGERLGFPFIHCTLCDRTSFSRHDIRELYCGACHLFHDVVAEGRRLLAAGGTHDCGEWVTGTGHCALCGVRVDMLKRLE